MNLEGGDVCDSVQSTAAYSRGCKYRKWWDEVTNCTWLRNPTAGQLLSSVPLRCKATARWRRKAVHVSWHVEVVRKRISVHDELTKIRVKPTISLIFFVPFLVCPLVTLSVLTFVSLCLCGLMPASARVWICFLELLNCPTCCVTPVRVWEKRCVRVCSSVLVYSMFIRLLVFEALTPGGSY